MPLSNAHGDGGGPEPAAAVVFGVQLLPAWLSR
ncbi:hypothetical protein J2S68_001446 [Glycomyces algeriensis]|nr:hypothetical protein [Glycomyces algeriensis]